MFSLVTVLTTGVWFWLYTNGVLVALDTRLQDKLFMPRAASDEIVLVTIDNASIQKLGVWPFQRSLHAQVIDFIAAAEPRVIGYDVTFSEASIALEDQILADTLARHDEVVLASEAVLEIRKDGLPMAISTLEPLPMFVTDDTKAGPTTLIPDSDGVIRQVPTTYVERSNEPAKSFALLVAEAMAGESLQTEEDLLRVAYVGGPGSFATVSFADVVAGQVSKSVFTDKTVLIGATAPDLHDEYLTPFGAGQATPGVEIQANIVQSLLEGRHVRTLTELQVAIVFGVLMLLGLVLGLSLRLRNLALAAVIVLIGYLLVAVALAGQDLLLPIIHPLILIGCIFGVDVLYRYRDEYARRAFIEHAFGRYVAPAVVEKLASGQAPLALGGLKEELTILFSDIRGFTSLSERMAPEELVTFLNEYLTGMTDIVLDHEGTVDKYIGDAVMAFWGAPLAQTDHAVRGISAAVAMKKRLVELNAGWKAAGRPTIEIGVGLNTGRVIVGNIGSERRFDYTVIGDDVNLASRLESLTKFYGVSILISAATKKQLGDRFLTRALDKVAVKGKKEAVRIFEVIAEAAEATQEQKQFVLSFEDALGAYYQRDWSRAEKLLIKLTGDKVAQLFIERCQKYAKEDPGEAWDGIYVATEK